MVHAAAANGVEKLLYLGSSCIYPKFAPQPIAESALLTGPLEATNEWYAVAKIAGLKLCQAYRRQFGCDFVCAMPTNFYGPGDNLDLKSSHVIPALIRKADDAMRQGRAELVIWESGTPRREFLHVDDAADALVRLMTHYSAESHVNVGSGSDVSILELAKLIARVVGFSGEVIIDRSKPDGTPRKLLDFEQTREPRLASSHRFGRGACQHLCLVRGSGGAGKTADGRKRNRGGARTWLRKSH